MTALDAFGLSRSDRFWQKWLMRIRPAFIASALKRLLGLRRREVLTAHGRFYIDPVSQFGKALTSAAGYEPEMQQTLARFLKPGDTFVDIGANEGYFTVIAANQVGSQGRVLAVEPQQRLAEVLARNLQINSVEWVVCESCAISDQTGEVQLHISPDTNTGSSGLAQTTRYRVATTTVVMTTLAALLQSHQLQQVDLLKMDIEGFEYEAILGSRELFLQHRIKALALELHPWVMQARGLDPGAIEGFLRSAGYVLAVDAPTAVWVLAD